MIEYSVFNEIIKFKWGHCGNPKSYTVGVLMRRGN